MCVSECVGVGPCVDRKHIRLIRNILVDDYPSTLLLTMANRSGIQANGFHISLHGCNSNVMIISCL